MKESIFHVRRCPLNNTKKKNLGVLSNMVMFAKMKGRI
jgi:hypothetical protein